MIGGAKWRNIQEKNFIDASRRTYLAHAYKNWNSYEHDTPFYIHLIIQFTAPIPWYHVSLSFASTEQYVSKVYQS